MRAMSLKDAMDASRRSERDEFDTYDDPHPSNNYRFSVAGVTFENRQERIDDVAKRIHDGEPLTASIVRDPDNEYDSNACEVHVLDQQIGFVPRELAAFVARMMDSGHTVRVTSVEFYETTRGKSGCRIGMEID